MMPELMILGILMTIIESENRSNIDNCNNADYKNDIMVILHTNDIKEEIK